MKLFKQIRIMICMVPCMMLGSLQAIDPTFQIKNNSSGEIQYELMQGKKSITGGIKTLMKGYSGKFNLDISQATTIHLYHCLTKESCRIAMPKEGEVAKTKVTFPSGKTIYIKFDGKKIEPQKGVKGRTSEGYNTDNNVTKDDIKPVTSYVGKNRTI